MSNERPIQELLARCVAIMVNYHNTGPREHAMREMIAEIRAVAEASKTFSLEIDDVVEWIFRPVEAELFARYGHELGSRMNSQFLMAFEGYGMGGRMPPPSFSDASSPAWVKS